MDSNSKIIVALDVNSVDEAISLVEKFSPYAGGFKIGFQLMTAMFASVMVPLHAVNSRFNIHKLFRLLGCDVLKALWLVEKKAKGSGCVGIICTPQIMILVGKNGEQLGAITAAGEPIKRNVVGDYVEVGLEFTQASDPIAALKEEEAGAESELEQLRRIAG